MTSAEKDSLKEDYLKVSDIYLDLGNTNMATLMKNIANSIR